MTFLRCLVLMLATLAAMPVWSQATSPATILSLIGQAEQAVGRGDHRAAEGVLSRIPANSVDGLQLARVQLVRAEIGRLRQQPDTMLRSLPPTADHVPALAARIEAMRGQAHFMAGDAVLAVRALVDRERWLRDETELADNRDRIWRGLIVTPLPAAVAAEIVLQEPMVRGWLEFAAVLQDGAQPAALDAWRQRYPDHPAAARIRLVRPSQGVAGSPPGPPPGAPGIAGSAPFGGVGAYGGQDEYGRYGGVPAGTSYAVLLPLSGSLANGGTAVRDGIVAAWFAAPAPRPALRFYDTRGDAGTALVAWETAVRDGAQLIIGPLTKPAVSIITRQGTARPWVALNYAEQPPADVPQIPGLQFGLAPEDEARAAAQHALSSGRRQALALYPDTEWGARAFQAFAQAFSSQGGQVLDHVRVKAGTQDFGDAMRQLLRLEGSRSRHQQLTQVLGQPSEFEPRARNDSSLLFAPLRAEEIRALAPQLGYFRAGSLTTYVISAAHDGRVDEQLEGLTLCDMPWVMSGAGQVEDQRARDALNFPLTVRSQPRLFALGRDGFALAQAMSQGRLHHVQDLPGVTGRLQVAPGGRVSRHLDCRPVTDGRAMAGA